MPRRDHVRRKVIVPVWNRPRNVGNFTTRYCGLPLCRESGRGDRPYVGLKSGHKETFARSKADSDKDRGSSAPELRPCNAATTPNRTSKMRAVLVTNERCWSV